MTILERNGESALIHFFRFLDGGLAIVRVNEVDIGTRQQLFGGDAESSLPCRINSFEISVETGDTEHIERKCEELIELFFSAATLTNRLGLVGNASAKFNLRHHQTTQRFQRLLLIRRKIPRDVIEYTQSPQRVTFLGN